MWPKLVIKSLIVRTFLLMLQSRWAKKKYILTVSSLIKVFVLMLCYYMSGNLKFVGHSLNLRFWSRENIIIESDDSWGSHCRCQCTFSLDEGRIRSHDISQKKRQVHCCSTGGVPPFRYGGARSPSWEAETTELSSLRCTRWLCPGKILSK
jgi:hypothetical protein